MKKIIKLATMLLVVLLMAVAVTGCNNETSGTTTTENTSANNASAVEQLNTDEKSLYNVLTNKMSSFKDPKSLVLTEVTAICNKGIPQIKISATNGFGGTSMESYYAFTKFYTSSNEFVCFPTNTLLSTSTIWTDTDNKTFLLLYTKCDLSKELVSLNERAKLINAYEEFLNKNYNTSQYNVSKINAALKEYKESMGWL